MARRARNRWRDWRVSPGNPTHPHGAKGRTIRQNLKGDFAEKKRKARAATVGPDVAESRRRPTVTWKLNRFEDAECHGCGDPIEQGAKFAFLFPQHKALCVACVVADPDLAEKCRPDKEVRALERREEAERRMRERG